MRPPNFLCLAPVFAALPLAAAPGLPQSIVRIPIAPEADERRPVEVPTEPENTVELDFPWAIEDWAGRGFTPNTEKYAGDFVIEAARGSARLFVTPVAAGAHRVLHVILAGPGRSSRGFPIEFVPAPTGLAWRKVAFTEAENAEPRRRPVTLAASVPQTRLREPSADSELGLIRTLRLMLNTDAGGATAIAAANPALELKILDGEPHSFGDFTLSNRFALRDSTTDTLGICASVANQTARRLIFDQQSWIVRAGDRVYPVRTVDFAEELEPGSEGVAFLILTRGPAGEPTLLRPDNDLRVSVLLSAEVNPRPVRRVKLEGFEPQ
jgi:hypothetical protein